MSRVIIALILAGASITVVLSVTNAIKYRSLAIEAQAALAEKHVKPRPSTFEPKYLSEIVRRDANLPIFGSLDARTAATSIRDYVYRNFTFDNEIHRSAHPKTKYALLGTPDAKMKCGGASEAYLIALQSLNIPARTVQLAGSRYLSGKDPLETHVTVEVLIEGRWEISDPFFNSSFVCNGQGGNLSVPGVIECIGKGGVLTPKPGKTQIEDRIVATYPTPYRDYFSAYVRQPAHREGEVEEWPEADWLQKAASMYE